MAKSKSKTLKSYSVTIYFKTDGDLRIVEDTFQKAVNSIEDWLNEEEDVKIVKPIMKMDVNTLN